MKRGTAWFDFVLKGSFPLVRGMESLRGQGFPPQGPPGWEGDGESEDPDHACPELALLNPTLKSKTGGWGGADGRLGRSLVGVPWMMSPSPMFIH